MLPPSRQSNPSMFPKVCSALFNFAVREEIIDRNPALGLGKWGTTQAYRRWTDEEMRAFEASCPLGPMLTAYMLARFANMRRSDVIALTWSKYDGAHITIVQEKTRKFLALSVYSELREYLDSLLRGNSVMVVPSDTGKKFDKSKFSNRFRAELVRAGLPADVHFHGLDKNCMATLAERGCTISEMMAHTGRSMEMCEYYSREANQKTLSAAAVIKMEAGRKGRD